MSIHHHARNIEHITQNHVGSFAADAGKRRQILHPSRNFPRKSPDDFLSASDNTFCFRAEEARRVNFAFEGVRIRMCEMFHGTIFFEKRRRNLIDPFVGTLSGKNGSCQKLKRIFNFWQLPFFPLSVPTNGSIRLRRRFSKNIVPWNISHMRIRTPSNAKFTRRASSARKQKVLSDALRKSSGDLRGKFLLGWRI